jgi:hypothetical protein
VTAALAMDTAHKLLEALLFVVLGVAFYVWQMRQIRRDRADAARKADAETGGPDGRQR